MEREYKLVYRVDDQNAIAKLQAIRNNVYMVHAEVTKTIGAMNMWNTTLASFGREGVNTFRQVEAAAGVFTSQTRNGALAVKEVGRETGALLPAWQVFAYGVTMAGKFGEAVNEARDRMQKLAKETIELRDDFRELANLQGHAGPDDEVLGRTVQMGMDAGLTPGQARRFMEQWEGSIPAGRQKHNITPEVEKGLAVEGMKFGSRVALNEKTAGDISASIAQYGKIGSVEEGAGMLGRIAHGLNEGRGNLEPLMRSLIKTAGATVEEHGGPVESLDKLAALLGVASMNATPDRAGTQLVNAVRGLRKFDGKQGEALRALGVTPEMKYFDALQKIAPELIKADATGRGGDTYLREAGFVNEDEIRALVQQSRNIALVRERINHKLGGKDVIEADRQFLEWDRTGVTRRVRAGKEGRDFLTGQKQELKQMAREAGQNMLRDEGWTGGWKNTLRLWAEDYGGAAPYVGVKKASQREAEEIFVTNLQKEAGWVGISVQDEYEKRAFKAPARGMRAEQRDQGKEATYQYNIDFDMQEDFIREMVERVEERGGNPWGTNRRPAERIDRVIEQDRTRRSRLEARRGGDAAPAQAAPHMGGVEQRLDKMVRQNEETNRLLRQNPAGAAGGGTGPVTPGRK